MNSKRSFFFTYSDVLGKSQVLGVGFWYFGQSWGFSHFLPAHLGPAICPALSGALPFHLQAHFFKALASPSQRNEWDWLWASSRKGCGTPLLKSRAGCRRTRSGVGEQLGGEATVWRDGGVTLPLPTLLKEFGREGQGDLYGESF